MNNEAEPLSDTVSPPASSHVYVFQPKARTVDHLGREQIADTPTAVTELWKNAYDAYARNVTLQIFDGKLPIAAVLDDGSGMSTSSFIERWLVLGTESKLGEEGDDEAAVADRDGLPVRVRQGQKGIGRLSVAFLGPSVLVITKKKDTAYTAALVDWRLFENPYLLLGDIGIPVREFASNSDFGEVFAALIDDSMDNVWGIRGTSERNSRVTSSWQRLSDTEKKDGAPESTAERIASSLVNAEIPTRALEEWSVWNGLSEHGTALILLEIRDELRAWVDPARLHNDAEAANLRAHMMTTLAGFSDPFSPRSSDFSYGMIVHSGESQRAVVMSQEQLGLADLRAMEHFIEGRFDEYGIFTGRVRAFNKDFGTFSMTPSQPVRTARMSRLGPFDLCLGTFEQESTQSTHPPEIHQVLVKQLETMAGLRIYRDGLRVLPYGRPDFDFFGIEERRTKHAGREFWNHRRMFGRVGITKADNPNLRDKAGREGLIENAARRELRDLVVALLEYSARKYFGNAAEHRDQFVKEIRAFNESAAAADKKVGRARVRNMNNHLKAQSAPLDHALLEVEALSQEIQEAWDRNDANAVLSLASRIEQSKQLRSDLRPPPKPARLGRSEADYRSFRNRYSAYTEGVDAVAAKWSSAAEAVAARQPVELAKSTFSRHQKFLTDDINKRLSEVKSLFAAEQERLDRRGQEDRSYFYKVAFPLIADLESGKVQLNHVLATFETIREGHHNTTARFYAGYAAALKQLADDVDLDAAVAWSSEERASLEGRVEQLTGLAQLGVTVEIIGHELEALDAEVGRNLRRLPAEMQQLNAFRLALAAQEALVNRLRFLAPLRLSGPQLREKITGVALADYLKGFFEPLFRAEHIDFEASPAFLNWSTTDLSSRLYPVFINLINNAAYWVKQASVKQIKLDVHENEVCISDTGPGVDVDDEEHLFELFFSRRVGGRGVGLYLCKANLAASGHTIRFQNAGPCLSGANFLIDFRRTDA